MRRFDRIAQELFFTPPPTPPEPVPEDPATGPEPARQAQELGFLARVLVQATLPHSRPRGHELQRSTGLCTLHMYAPPEVGLPYGPYPRLLLAWLATEAVCTRSRHLRLGPTFTGFVNALGLPAISGKRGTAYRLRDQMHRLLSTAIHCTYADDQLDAGHGFLIASHHELWWKPRDSAPGRGSTITLGQELFDDLIRHAVPVDVAALRALKHSALALDVYAWLTYRLSFLEHPVRIPWSSLRSQLGADYARLQDFRRKLLFHLRQGLEVYPQARVSPVDGGLLLEPSPPHVAPGRPAPR